MYRSGVAVKKTNGPQVSVSSIQQIFVERSCGFSGIRYDPKNLNQMDPG